MSRNRAILGASLVAIATTSAWMTMSASPAMTNSTPAAQSQPASQPRQSPSAPQPQATPAPAATASTAAQTPTAAPAAKPSASAAQTPATAVPAGSAAQQAHIDPKTGQLRPTEHDDAAVIASKSQTKRLARSAAAEPQQFATENAVGVAVPDEVQPYTVATKTPDGKIVIEHVQGGKAAADKVKQNSSKKGLSHRKEEPNDR
jgi:hypothetical protein